MQFPRLFLLALLGQVPVVFAAEPPVPPKATDDRLTVELVAMEPEIRTPTAIASDARGRVWVLENNTHFRPQNYQGPPTDRVVVLEDFGPDGRARKSSVWAEGFRDGMGILALPDGDIIVSTRSETIRFRDKDNDGKAEERTTLLKLNTTTAYPHNGLSGITQGPGGKIYLGLGENFGAPWALKGADGTELQGADEGAIFRINADGTGLERWALGVWNPFGLTFGKDGQLFALDNDPGGGSLCRLLHIVRGGDYGYRFRYGRTVDHPFLSWFGQIPGTLPPVCLAGEAPCGIISYSGEKKGGLPSEYHGDLIGATWGEHGLQRFSLSAKGASYTSKPEWFVRGGNDFRPSGVAEAPDGSLFVSDWVDGSYELHGKGRIWRVRAKSTATASEQEKQALTSRPGLSNETAKPLPANIDFKALEAMLRKQSSDPFVFHSVLEALALPAHESLRRTLAIDNDSHARLAALLASRRSRLPTAREFLPQWLGDSDGTVRRAALQWISEDGLKELLPQLDAVLEGQPTRATFEAYLASLQMLTSGKPDPKATVEQTAKVAFDPNRAPELRALALRLLPPDYAPQSVGTLRSLLDEKNDAIRTEAVRILAARSDDAAQTELRRIAADGNADRQMRAEAIAGLAHSAAQPETQQVLRAAQASNNPELVRLAFRSAAQPLPNLASEQQGDPLVGAGDAAAGRRIFYHPNGPRCFTCHVIEGRGRAVGPDLTSLGRFTPAELLDAIRQPSKDIAPAYAQWHVKMRDGKEGVGIDLFEDNKSEITLIDAAAQRTKYKVNDMETREELRVSMMPPGLDTMLITQELRDLIAFLREKRE
ncbi:PVC-type heme-binding CxxCH protein [Verrucomicrobiota bacterium sgz303538]